MTADVEEFIIICRGLAGRAFTYEGKPPPKGQYLEFYDPEAHQGRGYAAWTNDLSAAMRFTDQLAAFKCWTSVPKRRPTRPDGQPNKPLTAFTVEILPLTFFEETDAVSDE